MEKHSSEYKLRRVVNNTIISILGQAVTWTSTLLLMICYGRFLGGVQFGELYFATTFVLLMGIPVESGFDQQIIRGVSREPSKALSYYSNILLIKIVTWLVIYSLILLVSWLLGYSAEVRILVGICGYTLLISGIASTFAWIHYALERVIFPVVGTILEKGLSALIGYLLLKHGAGVQSMALVLLGGSFVSGVWQAAWFFRLIGTRFVIDPALIRELIRSNLPFLVYGVLMVIYYRIDTILLSLMTNDAVVGWYGASVRIFDTLNFLPNLIIMTIMYPIFSKLSTTSDTSLKLAVEKSTNFLLFFAIPIATALITIAPNIIGFLFHRTEFTHAIPSLQALAPGLIFLYLNYVLGTTILSRKGQDKKIPIMAAIALIFNLSLNLILIPVYQHVGAAIITSLTELLLFCMSVAIIPKHLLPLGSLWVGAKALIASLAMALVIWNLRAFNIFLILLIGILVYFGAAMLLRTIPREDIRALYSAIRHKVQQISPLVDAQQIVEEQELTLSSASVQPGNLALQLTNPIESTLPVLSAPLSFIQPAEPSEALLTGSASETIATFSTSADDMPETPPIASYDADASLESGLEITVESPAINTTMPTGKARIVNTDE